MLRNAVNQAGVAMIVNVAGSVAMGSIAGWFAFAVKAAIDQSKHLGRR